MKIEERVMTFEGLRRTALWGEEHWLVSAHRVGQSVVASGINKGRLLGDVAPGFPLLVKEIVARDRLSVQVHPSEKTKRVSGGEAKTELWCALSSGYVYAGLKEGVTPKDVLGAVNDGNFEELMVRHDLKAGDVLLIPGGMVHTIGEWTRIYEVQQSSNTTFRLYDWGRVGPDGNPRELHIAQALKAIDYSLKPPVIGTVASCEFFDFRRVRVDGEVHVEGGGLTILYAYRGAFTLGSARYDRGSSLLVTDGEDFTLTGKGAEVFITKGKQK